MGPLISRARKHLSWTGVVLALGLGLRLYHYLRNPSMWHDEAALVLNVLDKDFPDLLGPLAFAEAAPPLFLWIEKAVTLLLGDSTYALRLVPFLASCAALGIAVPTARGALRPAAVPWALLLLACSDHLLWHCCEAKPYSVDVFAASLLTAVFCATTSWGIGGRLVAFGLLGLVLIFLVYPGCFLCGGLLVALLPEIWRTRQVRGWLGYGLIALTFLAAFALLWTGPIRAQQCEAILACWQQAFPCWERFWSVPAWTALASLELFRYCFEPVGQLLLPLAVAGALRFWRRGLHGLLLLLLLPVILPLGAAYLHAYPFGGSRVLVYVAPALALCIAEGLPLQAVAHAASLESDPIVRHRRSQLARFCGYGLVVCTLLPLVWAMHRAADPWQRADCAGAAQYVLAARQPGDCVAANHWEYRYYFRCLGPGFSLLENAAPVEQGRLWLVTTANTAADRAEIPNHFGTLGWRTLEQRDFVRTSVRLLSRSSCPDSARDVTFRRPTQKK